MANRPHVPKFGDWNNQDQPFTVVFDNARTNKRQDLYESVENSDVKPQAKAPLPPQPAAAPRNPRPDPPKPVRDDTPRAPPPAEKINRVRAPPAEQLYGGKGGGGGRGGVGGLYGGYGAGGGSGNQRQPQAPRPVQPKQNPRGGRGVTTIPPFPGSVGAGQDMSYTHIFDQVKEERREAGRPYGGSSSTGNTPSRPINNKHQSPAPTSSKVCCFPWSRRGSKY
uniref:RPM1-interacting protein 4 n=1 Tax=Noccaea caerulescens TaxID=107243 RepID=A0A1J3ESI5_NOCCA